MENCGLVSIIVPVYNADKWLGYCLNALMAQSYPWFEAILINDGSTDSSQDICSQYEELDSRFRVITTENGGVSRARNIGIAAATGKWLCFVDSDDVAPTNMLEQLVGAATRTGMELVVGNKLVADFSVPKGSHTLLTSRWLGKGEHILGRDSFAQQRMRLIWHTALLEDLLGKLYSHELWKRLKLQMPLELSLGEDFVANMEYYDACNGIVFVDETVYYYNRITGSESLTNRYRPDLFENKMHLMHQLLAHLGPKKKQNQEEWGCFCNYVASSGLRSMKELVMNPRVSGSGERIFLIQKMIGDSLFYQGCEGADWVPKEFVRVKKYVLERKPNKVLKELGRSDKYEKKEKHSYENRTVIQVKKAVKHYLQALLKPMQRLVRYCSRLQTEELLNAYDSKQKEIRKEIERIEQVHRKELMEVRQSQESLENKFLEHVQDKENGHWNTKFGYDSLISNLQLNAIEQVVPGNRARLEALRGTHKGEKCFIIGNGPSLQVADLDKLQQAHVFCFAAKRINLLFNQTSWRPDVWGASDLDYIQEFRHEIDGLTEFPKLVPCQSIINIGCPIEGAIYFPFIQMERTPAWFNEDVTRGVHFWGTITCKLINFAVYMGFTEIYLLGVDNSWPVKKDKDGKLVIDENQKANFAADYYTKGTDEAGHKRLTAWGKENFVHSIQYITQSYHDINWHCEQLGVKIYNATRGGMLEEFERIDFEKALTKF